MPSASLPHIIPESSKSIYNQFIRRPVSDDLPDGLNNIELNPSFIKEAEHFEVDKSNNSITIIIIVILLILFAYMIYNKKK